MLFLFVYISMNKILIEGTMTRSKLRNKFVKRRKEEDLKSYIKQRNHCVKLLRKAKWKCKNLDEKILLITENFGNS